VTTRARRGTVAEAAPIAESYFTWQTTGVSLRDRRVTVCSKPGVRSHRTPDVASTLLAEAIAARPTDSVLIFNCGASPVGPVAAGLATDGRVVLADANVVEVEAARRTLAVNRVANATAHLSSGIGHLPELPPTQVVAVRLPKGRQATLQLIWDGFLALEPGGRFYLAGANDEGIQAALAQVQSLFGNVGVLQYRKGCRVGVAEKSSFVPALSGPLLDHRRFHQYAGALRGGSYVVCSRPGVFSWEKLDAGTRLLIDAMEIRPGEQVLDLGCGTGVVGVVAARLTGSGKVFMVDAEVDAVDAASQTAQINGAANCTVLPSDVTSAVRDVRFDVVVTNPPFHLAKATDHDVAAQFILEAARVLRPAGRLYVIANRFLPYETELRTAFTTVETIFADNRYKVLVGRGPGRQHGES